jgi:aerobic carbon-monoxide dehydrogenase large subunit
VLFGDTDLGGRSGMGSLADRGAPIGATAVWQACQILKEKASLLAAHRLGVEEKTEAARFQEGHIVFPGSKERRIGVSDVANDAWLADSLPEGMEPGLEATATYEPVDLAYTYGVLLVVVDVEIDTGIVTVTDAMLVNDCGVLIDQDMVEAQIKGGVVQGLGDALLSEIVYSKEGQPLSTSLARYLVPTASMAPRFTISHIQSPAPGVATGAKGAGETGIIGAPAAIALAIEDAVGAPIDRLPVTPFRLWKQTTRGAGV